MVLHVIRQQRRNNRAHFLRHSCWRYTRCAAAAGLQKDGEGTTVKMCVHFLTFKKINVIRKTILVFVSHRTLHFAHRLRDRSVLFFVFKYLIFLSRTRCNCRKFTPLLYVYTYFSRIFLLHLSILHIIVIGHHHHKHQHHQGISFAHQQRQNQQIFADI